jgi:flagellar basal body rod protein FlgB
MDNTIDAVRLALRMQELAAQAASLNIANAGHAGAQPLRFDVAAAQAALADAAAGKAGGDGAAVDARLQAAEEALASAAPVPHDGAIDRDAEVADMVAASTRYQALTEGLGRSLGLMRLAIGGRS